MKRSFIVVGVVALVGAGAYYMTRGAGEEISARAGAEGGGQGGNRGGGSAAGVLAALAADRVSR